VLKRISAITTASAAATALAVSLSVAPSSATTAVTWTISPGGSVTTSGRLVLKDTSTGTPSFCKSVTLHATLKSGSGLDGAGIGSITSGTFTGCYLDGGNVDPLSVVDNDLPWKLKATSYDAKTGISTGMITGIGLTINGALICSAVLDGTAAGADNGVIRFTYTNSTGKLKLLPVGSSLHWWAVLGCYGLLGKGGDPVQPTSGPTVMPQQTITSP
jgi:hypothetical protein